MRAVVTVVVGGLIGLGGCASSDESPIRVSPGDAREDLGKADGDTGPRSELKLTVDEYAIDDVLDSLGLDSDLAEVRDVWFYDTGDLDLFEEGLILRARSVEDDDDDSTVKIRPLDADDVDPALFAEKNFKCETDWTPTRSVSSCSYGNGLDEDEIEEAADGERDIDSLFNDEQETFAADHGPAFDWDALEPLGPVPAQVWKLEHDDLPEELTAELWRLPGEEFLELSIKVADDEVDEAFDELEEWLDDRDVPLSSTQETKTRRALEILTGTK